MRTSISERGPLSWVVAVVLVGAAVCGQAEEGYWYRDDGWDYGSGTETNEDVVAEAVAGAQAGSAQGTAMCQVSGTALVLDAGYGESPTAEAWAWANVMGQWKWEYGTPPCPPTPVQGTRTTSHVCSASCDSGEGTAEAETGDVEVWAPHEEEGYEYETEWDPDPTDCTSWYTLYQKRMYVVGSTQMYADHSFTSTYTHTNCMEPPPPEDPPLDPDCTCENPWEVMIMASVYAWACKTGDEASASAASGSQGYVTGGT